MADANHINREGADKISRYLGKLLKENHALPDHRHDAEVIP
jgi:hypothetical protein